MGRRFEEEEGSAHAGHQAVVDFEALLSDLSAAFVRVSVDQIDNEIERWMERIVFAMGVDRSTIAQVDPADKVLYVSHQWAREGFITADLGFREPDIQRLYPWLLAKMRAGEPLILSRLDDLPLEAATDRESARQDGTKSDVTIPVKIGGTVVGAVFFGAIRFEKHWSEQEVQRLKLVAEIFASALERKRAEAEIRHLSEEPIVLAQVIID